MAIKAITGHRPAARGATLSVTVGVIFALVCALAAGNVVLVRGMVREHNGVAESVGVAGKLRMLSQKIAFEAAYLDRAPPGWRARLAQSRGDYVASLDALAGGGSAFGLRVNPPSAQQAARLARLRAEWRLFSSDVDVVLRDGPAAPDLVAMRRVAGRAGILLAQAEGVVAQITLEARAAQERALHDIHLLLAADVVLLALAYQLVRRKAAQRLATRQLEYNANHDALTGLANRNLLADRMRGAIAGAHRSGRMVAVLLHDLDNFKVINDSLGHAAGDLLLVSVARRMCEAVRASDTVARLGGDEFVIVMPDVARAEDAAAVGEKVLQLMSQPFHIDGQKVYVRTSIGISLYPRDGTDEQTLLKNVDLAMYRAKQQGRGRLSFFTEEMNEANRARQRMEVELHNALERGEFVLHYQPRHDTRSGRMRGVEALLRWNHPRHGMVGPAEFIPLAEDNGLISLIGAWVLREACGQCRRWQRAGLPAVAVAVNLSARQLQRDELLPLVRGALDAAGLAPRWLELEITETAIMRDAEEAVPLLEELKAIGVGLSLDDFGTGYSSLNYLRRFPLDSLKIDRSFVSEIGAGSEGAIITAMIAMARSLRLRVIAEGVESAEQEAFLRAQGSHELQGFRIGQPMAADALEALLRRQPPAQAATGEAADGWIQRATGPC